MATDRTMRERGVHTLFLSLFLSLSLSLSLFLSFSQIIIIFFIKIYF